MLVGKRMQGGTQDVRAVCENCVETCKTCVSPLVRRRWPRESKLQ